MKSAMGKTARSGWPACRVPSGKLACSHRFYRNALWNRDLDNVLALRRFKGGSPSKMFGRPADAKMDWVIINLYNPVWQGGNYGGNRR